MPRTCLACNSQNREAIDKALANGTPLRDIERQWDISRSALDRHKRHVATAIKKVQEQREEDSGTNSLEEMLRIKRKAWELQGKMETEGDHRGSVVALREARECEESRVEMMNKAGDWRTPLAIGTNFFRREVSVIVEHITAGSNEQEMPADDAGKETPSTPVAPKQIAMLAAPALPALPEVVPEADRAASDATKPNGNGNGTAGLIGMSFAVFGRHKRFRPRRGGE